MKNSLGERVRQMRRKKGLTQAQLGSMSGVNQPQIHKIESDFSGQPRGIMRIAEVLEVNPAWLQFGDLYADRKRPNSIENVLAA